MTVNLALGAIALALIVAAHIRSTVFSSLQVKRMRWRTRYRMRPGPGFASHMEITVRWSRWAAVFHGRRTRPDMAFWGRVFSPATGYALRLGRAMWFRRIFARGEDQVGVIAPPRTGKTGLLMDWIFSHPGAAVCCTTRADVHARTSGKRARLGPIEVFNPEGIGDVASTLRIDIVRDCADPAVAARTASALIGPVLEEGDNAFWNEKARSALAGLLHAAALLGADMSAVWAWSNRAGEHQVREAASRPGASLDALAPAFEIQRDSRTADSVRSFVCRALTWVAIPSLRDMVTGPGLRNFDAGKWAASRGTIYFISSGEGSVSEPLFRTVVERIYHDVVVAGSRTPYERNPVQVLFALDEVTQTCSVPLHEWLATGAGSGVKVVYVVHTPHQLEARYGPAVAKAIWALAGVKIILGGNSDEELAEAIQKLSGSYGNDISEHVVPVAYLRQLPEGRALVIAMNRSPIAVKVRPLWKRISQRRILRPVAARLGWYLPPYVAVPFAEVIELPAHDDGQENVA